MTKVTGFILYYSINVAIIIFGICLLLKAIIFSSVQICFENVVPIEGNLVSELSIKEKKIAQY